MAFLNRSNSFISNFKSKLYIAPTLIGLLALYGLYAVIGGYNRDFGRDLIPFKSEQSCQPDLYALSLVNDFNHEINCVQKNPELNNPDSRFIITGDCFFEDTNNGKRFIDLISEKLPGFAWNAFGFSETEKKSLLDLLGEKKVLKKDGVLILGLVERYTIDYFLQRNLFSVVEKKPEEEVKRKTLLEIVKYNLSFFDTKLDTTHFDYFYTHNFIFYPFLKIIKTIRFKITGDIGSDTLSSIRDENRLFLKEDVDFHNRGVTSQEIEEMAHRVGEFKKQLKLKHGLDLAVFIFPNKFSIYGNSAVENFKYNNFIPELTHALKKREVIAIDTYNLLNNQKLKAQVYEPADSHLSESGKHLLLEEMIKELK